MRWWWGAVLSLALGVGMQPARASDGAARAPSTLLIDAVTGQSLREHDADTPGPPGSLNQLMVLLLSLEQADLGALRLNVPVSVSDTAVSHAAATDGTPNPIGTGKPTVRNSAGAAAEPRIPLRTDKVYLLSDLLKAMLITSAHDAAVVAAEAIAGSVPACLELMNARAERLGMRATHYASVGGVRPDGALQSDSTTARDLARLAQALVRHPAVLEWAPLSGLPFDEGAILLRNVNQLIGKVRGVDGLQVSTSRAPRGRTTRYSIVATAQRGALRLIAVVLAAADSAARYNAAAELLEWGFAQYERLEIVRKGEALNLPIRVVNGSVTQLTPVVGKTVSLLRRRDEERDLQVRYQLPTVLEAPLKRHQPIGEVIVEEKGQLVAVVPILSPAKVVATHTLSAALP